ncbi:glycosyltransferase involved in cell wall biosynthesis [Deinobacterium chartae]|uniref:Glycosyltransferase involved in cell wall biosynthesis n=1 Tax=Deinobacterium chartae TaxID=521158 RepID=A0A841I448_9DEIO|nr:glycosyltransferase family 4 protein [Deinobacterium chartae]MBB6099806.1 glycosyltransferase involved in cell wall biosynthesis [Deinobacterium chartae]
MIPLSIGLFSDAYLPDPNGVSTSVYLLARELRRLGHDAWVVAPAHPGAPIAEEGVVRLRSLLNPFFEGQRVALPRARRLPARFDLIHTHTPLVLGMWGSQLARRQGVAHVSTYHTHYEHYAHYVPGLRGLNRAARVIPRMARAFYDRTDLIIAPSPAVGELARSYGLRPPVRLLPGGIDFEVLAQAADLPSPWPVGSRRLLTVSRLGEEKNVAGVLEAFSRIRDPGAHLLVVGEGPQRLQLEGYVRWLGIAGRVTFTGRVPYTEIGALYRQAELFLFASETETQGLVLLEAQAMGVPVVAVGAQGTLWGVRAGESGYLVAPGDTEALARRASLLLENPALHARFSRAAREFAAQYSAARVAERTLEAYLEVLGRRFREAADVPPYPLAR